MLVLSRKQGQSIVIANDIVVNIIDIGHGRVQIGVTRRHTCRFTGKKFTGAFNKKSKSKSR